MPQATSASAAVEVPKRVVHAQVISDRSVAAALVSRASCVARALNAPLLSPKQGPADVGRLREGTCYVIVGVPSGGAGEFNDAF